MPEMMFDAPVEKTERPVAPETEPVEVRSEPTEPKSALAIGLPAWSIEPPTVVVRRKARAI